MKELRVRLYSLKTKKTVKEVFYVGDHITSNLLSEEILYKLGILDRKTFEEGNLYKPGSQEEYIEVANGNRPPVFGQEEVVVLACNCGCGHTSITKGNLNSGGKKN